MRTPLAEANDPTRSDALHLRKFARAVGENCNLELHYSLCVFAHSKSVAQLLLMMVNGLATISITRTDPCALS